MSAVPQRPDVTGLWYYGPSGSGKSRAARDLFPGYYLKACNKWWDGYQDEANVIIEDFGPEHHVLGHHLKLWADRYDFIAECKGDSVRIRPQRIIVTSQYSIEQIFGDRETVAALLRRFSVRRFGEIPAENPLISSAVTYRQNS